MKLVINSVLNVFLSLDWNLQVNHSTCKFLQFTHLTCKFLHVSHFLQETCKFLQVNHSVSTREV